MSAPRTLEDWTPLPAERKLAAEIAFGLTVVIGDGTLPPENLPDTDPRVLRTSFLRALILGRIEGHPRHEKGVQVAGAYLLGDGPPGAETPGLDLEGCDLRADLALFACRVSDRLLLRSASLRNLYLNDSHLGAGLEADGLEAKGVVFLRGLVAQGEVRLVGARLGGDLSCAGARLTAGAGGDALSADGLEATGDVFLRGLEAQGAVRLVGAKLGGDLSCAGARLTAGAGGDALSADRLEAKGGVFLRGLVAQGAVRLVGAKLGGSLDCAGARLTAGTGGRALSASGMRVEGAFFLREEARIDGVLDLTGAQIEQLCDQADCWPSFGDLILDRCEFGGFTGQGVPVDADARIRWLSLQDESRWGAEFWPQPWEECARVLREMGHGTAARTILIEKEKRQRAARRARVAKALEAARRDRDAAAPEAGFRPHTDRVIGLWWQLLGLRVWDGILGAVVGYGRKPQNAAYWALGFLLLGAVIFGNAAGYGEIKPNDPRILRAGEWVACAEGGARAGGHAHQVACFRAQPEARSYPRFNAFIYSADTLIPVVSLEMQSYWIPDDSKPRGARARAYLWLHIAAGWALTLLAVAGFSGLIRTDNTK